MKHAMPNNIGLR